MHVALHTESWESCWKPSIVPMLWVYEQHCSKHLCSWIWTYLQWSLLLGGQVSFTPWPGAHTLCTRYSHPPRRATCWPLQVGTCTQLRPGPSSLGPCCVPDTKAAVWNKSSPCPLRGGQHPGKPLMLGDVHRGAVLPPRLTHPAALI